MRSTARCAPPRDALHIVAQRRPAPPP
jgi:hypothetical protein